MNFIDKARIRIDHWIHHSEDHSQEYVSFAAELEEAGKIEQGNNRGSNKLETRENHYTWKAGC
ncbi:MAG: hypothetical protein MUC98_09255 [Desulfobacterota bacterium]|nr:hypothetical protein [Thermodesulfobacteriota bacterium]